MYLYVIGYRIENAPKYFYFVTQIYSNKKHDIIDYALDLLKKRDESYLIRSILFEKPNREKADVWLIIDFHNKKYEAMFHGHFYKDCNRLHNLMNNRGYQRDIKRAKYIRGNSKKV